MEITGTHYVGDLSKCTCKREKLVNPERVTNLLNNIIEANDFKVVELSTGNFENKNNIQSGYTITVTLEESHIAIHTWPTELGVQIDIFLCDYSRNNAIRGEKITKELCKFFGCKYPNITILNRKLIY